ncbi:hypothetical protein V492_04825 [Pseudogymnoascus sp. VKM F-4246]|nr:hypothetical protein V492_04825 [Pseudogymnoascus sp. VKM F-4246]
MPSVHPPTERQYFLSLGSSWPVEAAAPSAIYCRAMRMRDPEPPEMSGGLRGNASVSNSTSDARTTLSAYSIGLETDDEVYELSDEEKVENRMGETFYIVSGPKNHGDRRRPPQKVEIRPALKPRKFKIKKPRGKHREPLYTSSLDVILRNSAKGPILDIPGANIPLPESDSERSSEDERRLPYQGVVKRENRSSLDAIIKMGNDPTMAPLPPSRPDSTLEAIGGPPLPTGPSPRLFKYSDMIRRASRAFNHFDKVLDGARSRNNNIANITSIDFLESSRSAPTEFVIDSSDSHNIRTLGSMGQIPANVKQRLLIVPDLAPQIINLLGNLFGLSPEVFEEHLINSGYNGAEYDDEPAHTWPTAKMKKSHASIKWYRPVQRLDEPPFSFRDLEVLLDPAQGRLKRNPDKAKDLRVCQTQSNIFRSEWEMWTDPKTTAREKRASAWEERATVWSQKIAGRDCYIVILILDPLPIIEVGTEQVVDAARIYRPEKIFGFYTSADDASVDSGEEFEHMRKLADKIQNRHASQKPTTQLQKMLGQSGRDRKQDDETASVLSQSFEMVKVKVLEPTSSHTVFKQIVPRAYIAVDLDEAFRSAPTLRKLGTQLSKTTSTKDEFCRWLDVMSHPERNEPHFAIITPLFHIIQQDSINLLSYLHKTLDEINVDMLGDAKMEDRIVMWRQIIVRAQLELPELKRSIASFFTFTQLLNADGELGVLDLFERLLTEIDDMIQRLQTASSSLTANMALLDSRRSIAEAQAVTKLTELAFFFIPLTFAATLFGMQVEQLATPAPISTFFALGIVFIASSYLVRLTIRSSWLRELIKAYKASIAEYAQDKRQPLKQGSVPASMFLRWVGHMVVRGVTVSFETMVRERFGKIILAVCLSSLVAVPLSVIWTQPLARGIKAAVTVVIVLLVVMVAVYSAISRLVSAARGSDDDSASGSDVDNDL